MAITPRRSVQHRGLQDHLEETKSVPADLELRLALTLPVGHVDLDDRDLLREQRARSSPA